MRYHWLLDNGHGGVNEWGDYTTCPGWKKNIPETWHKMYVHDGVPLYEGEFNRLVVDRISELLWEKGIDYTKLVPGFEDVSLRNRVKDANDHYLRDKRCIFVSIHGNAFNTSAQGFEVFTSKGETRSDKIADVFANSIEKSFPNKTMRFDLSDGDKDKEANFYVLKNTNMPAILTENFFFDNKEDAELMMSEEGINRIAQAHVDAIVKIEQGSY